MRTAARATPHAPTGVQRSVREILMGAQDNLTNVLAVVLGVSIGSGEMRTVALAGLAAGVAEAISMGGVLYTSTRAAQDLGARWAPVRTVPPQPTGRRQVRHPFSDPSPRAS